MYQSFRSVVGSNLWTVVATIGFLVSGCATRIDPVSVESVEIVKERWDVVDPLQGSQESALFLQLNVAGPQDFSSLDASILSGRCEVDVGLSGQKFDALLLLGYDRQLKLPPPEGPGDDDQFRYTFYTFPRLQVGQFVEAEFGWTIDSVRLAELEFDSISCYIAETTKVLPIPRKPQYWFVPSDMTRDLDWNRLE